MADITIEADVNKEEFEKLMEKSKDSLWHVAVLNAPYRTGNLRANIKRSIRDNKTYFIYDDLYAAYLDYLERGIGRNKKHTGFIEFKTTSSMFMEIVTTMLTKYPSYSGIPSIEMRTDVARNYERKLARKMGLGKNQRINANERAVLSFMHKRGNKKRTRPTDGYDNVSSPIKVNESPSRF